MYVNHTIHLKYYNITMVIMCHIEKAAPYTNKNIFVIAIAYRLGHP